MFRRSIGACAAGVFLMAAGAFAQQGPAKVGVISIQGAIVGTKDGQKASPLAGGSVLQQIQHCDWSKRLRSKAPRRARPRSVIRAPRLRPSPDRPETRRSSPA